MPEAGPPIYPEASLSPGPGDLVLGAEDVIRLIPAAAGRRKTLLQRPGAAVLRRYRAGAVICRQGDPGLTGFFVIPVERVQQFLAQGTSEAATPDRVASQEPPAESGLAGEAPASEASARIVATVHVFAGLSTARRPKGILGTIGRFFFGDPAVPKRKRRSITTEAYAHASSDDGIAHVREGEWLGELSCRSGMPRASTVVADQECYLVEMLRFTFLDILDEKGMKEAFEKTYRERILGSHLQQLEMLRGASEEIVRRVRSTAVLEILDPGAVVVEEGADADAIYLVRKGLVQVVTGARLSLPVSLGQVGEEAIETAWKSLTQTLHAAGQPAPPAESPGALQSEVDPAAAKAVPAKPMPGKAIQKSAPKPEELAREVSARLARLIAQELAQPARDAVAAAIQSGNAPAALRAELVNALNGVAHDRKFLARADVKAAVLSDARFQFAAHWPESWDGVAAKWSDVQARAFGQQVLAAGFQNAIPRGFPQQLRVIDYISAGDVFGEMGVVLQQPRSATCVAFDHPGASKRNKIELIRLPASTFRELMEENASVRERVQQLIAERKQHRRQVSEPGASAAPLEASAEFQQLGLVQGQKLLLVDLDKCTRCGECVTACVNTHDDGLSRLFLDGPRFDRFLVPSACRQCRDPVCLIGCPVSSIERGDNGEIVIRDWCIGCGVCARQCPYDSIQMHSTGVLGEEGTIWSVSPADRVSDEHWTRRGYNDHGWARLVGPIQNGLALAEALERFSGGASRDETADTLPALCLRTEFRVDPLWDEFRRGARKHDARHSAQQLLFRLTIATDTGNATPAEDSYDAWLDGNPLHGFEKKRDGDELVLPLERLRTYALAVRLVPRARPGGLVLKASIDLLSPKPPGAPDAAMKDVLLRAVVCDLCAKLPSGPACVQMCPHEAAIRFDAALNFPEL